MKMRFWDIISIKLYVHNWLASWIWLMGLSLIYNVPEKMVKGLVILVAHVLSRGGHSLSMKC